MRHLQGRCLAVVASLAGLSLAPPAVADDTLSAGELLYAGQAIDSGSTVLRYQGDNNLVLYQNGSAIWATMAGLGYPTDRFEMQTDCNAVVYTGHGYVWASWTNGQGSSCYARVIEGDWFICSGTTRVFSARGGGNCSGTGGRTPCHQCITEANQCRARADAANNACRREASQRNSYCYSSAADTYWDCERSCTVYCHNCWQQYTANISWCDWVANSENQYCESVRAPAIQSCWNQLDTCQASCAP